MDRSRLLPAALAVLASTTLPAACTDSSNRATHQEQSISSHPVTLDEVQRRTLQYADSVHSLSDVSAAAFSSAIGVSLAPIEAGAHSLSSGNLKLSTGQSFFASFVTGEGAKSLPIHKVAILTAAGNALTDDPKAPCFWEAEAVGARLEAAGFHRGTARPFQRGELQRYWRDLSNPNQVFDASLMTYTGQSEAGETSCVYAIRFSGGSK